MNQPNKQFTAWVRSHPHDMRVIARAAQRMLDEIDPYRWHSPFNYVCAKLPQYARDMYSPYLLTLLGQEFTRMNCGNPDLGNAFLNNFIDNRTYLYSWGAISTGIRRGRKNAYIQYRIMWLHFLVNMGELYS